MSVTLKDIAEKTGYTVATVSRALNDSPMVSERTKSIISQAASELGYVRNNSNELISIRNNCIGVIVPDITNPYFPLLVKGIQDTLYNFGYHIIFCNSNGNIETEKDHMKMLCSLPVKGIIMDPLSDDSYTQLCSIDPNIPVVFTGNLPKGNDINYIIIDNYKGAKKATKYLIGLGHKRIAYIGGNEDTFTYRERLRGYKDTMMQFFGKIDDNLIRSSYPDREHGFEEAAKFIIQGNIPTAIIAGNDLLALGVMECFIENGFDIPNDVSILGFDNIEFSSLPGVSLTTVEEPRYDIGALAAETMVDLLKNNASKPVRINIEPNLIMRKTCTKAKVYV